MKINEQWLREWVDPALDAAAIAETLTLAGLEIDGLSPAGPALEGVIVVEIRAAYGHPTVERLQLCEIFDGSTTQQVVCGAPNARVGLKSAYAVPGTTLPDGRRIEHGMIHGQPSAGMLCAAAELALGDDAAGILELPPDAVPGTALAVALALDDTVFEINLTPNRGDCFSVIGVARDLAALTATPLRDVTVTPIAAMTASRLPVNIVDTPGCPRYAGRVITGLDPQARTPLWMQERLRRVGLRCIHPLVDVTNYVMLEFGQPMHAFDLERLDRAIEVRGARPGEQMELLDGQVIELAEGVLVICDATAPVALAGVMGGQGSAVSAGTSSVFLESAFFDPIRLAGVARRYRLHTDASTRFERGVDPTMQVRAMERATRLILDICGGQPGPCELTAPPAAQPLRPAIAFRPTSVQRLLGIPVAEITIAEIFERLELQVSRAADVWQVVPPFFRFDLTLEADLIEEVARVYGYDRIPVKLPTAAALPAVPPASGERERQLRRLLCARGYFEAITYSFIEPALAGLLGSTLPTLALANPIASDMSVMRASLWPGLVGAARHNLNRQMSRVRLFEIGMVFLPQSDGLQQRVHIGGLRASSGADTSWSKASREDDFYDLKHDVESLLKNLDQVGWWIEAASHPALHPGQCASLHTDAGVCGYLGAVHPALADQLRIDKRMFLFELDLEMLVTQPIAQYQPISRFPRVRRDLSVVVPESVSAGDCLSVARAAAGEHLHDLQLFDVYRGQGIDSGKKSLALGLIFQARYSTLTDDEVEIAVQRVLRQLAERFGGSLRT